MRLSPEEALRRFADSDVATLATVDPERGVHVVPVVCSVQDGLVLIAVDDKPKRSRSLRRLDNIRTDDRVSLLANHHAEDWNRLWWVRIDGHAEIAETVGDRVEHLHRRRHPQLSDHRLGPWIIVRPHRVSGWAAS